MDQRKNSGKRNTGSNSLEEKLRSAQDEIDELKNRLLLIRHTFLLRRNKGDRVN
jgi:hypothetical protein